MTLCNYVTSATPSKFLNNVVKLLLLRICISSCKPIFNAFMWKNVLLLYLAGEVVHAQIQDVTSECYSPEVRNGSLANITCIFSYDIDKMKKNKIYVDHIPPDRSVTVTPETVLLCQWSGGNFTCNPKSGYKWTGYVSNLLTFEIPATLPTHGGQYWCDVLPSQPLNIKPCQLRVTGLNIYSIKDLGETNSSITTVNSTLRIKKAVTTRCVSQQVEYGSKAFINCCFSVDIRVLKKTIYVDHLPVDGSGTPETVLKCRWMNENMLCNTSAGYQLNGNVTKELIIQIPEAHDQHAGLYWCDVLPSNPEDIKQCSLSIKDVETSSRTTVNENTGRTDSVTESVPKVTSIFTAIGVSIAVITFILMLLILLIFWKRSGRRHKRKSNSERQLHSEDTELEISPSNGQTTESDDECLQYVSENLQKLNDNKREETDSTC